MILLWAFLHILPPRKLRYERLFAPIQQTIFQLFCQVVFPVWLCLGAQIFSIDLQVITLKQVLKVLPILLPPVFTMSFNLDMSLNFSKSFFSPQKAFEIFLLKQSLLNPWNFKLGPNTILFKEYSFKKLFRLYN